jgi:hypothetical protein
MLVNILCLFVGGFMGMMVTALCSVNKCNDCSYRTIVRNEIYPEMDKETT